MKMYFVAGERAAQRSLLARYSLHQRYLTVDYAGGHNRVRCSAPHVAVLSHGYCFSGWNTGWKASTAFEHLGNENQIICCFTRGSAQPEGRRRKRALEQVCSQGRGLMQGDSMTSDRRAWTACGVEILLRLAVDTRRDGKTKDGEALTTAITLSDDQNTPSTATSSHKLADSSHAITVVAHQPGIASAYSYSSIS